MGPCCWRVTECAGSVLWNSGSWGTGNHLFEMASLGEPVGSYLVPPPSSQGIRKELGTSEEDSQGHKVVMMANVLGRIYKDCSGGYLFW